MLVATFFDSKLEAEIINNGFVVIPGFIPQSEINCLLGLFNSHYNGKSVGFWNSISDLPMDLGLGISEKIKAITNPHFDKLLKDWEFPIAQFIVKNPNKDSASTLHRDFSIYDEDKIQYRQVWVPLVDLNADNGALYVVPKSHKLFTNSRPMFAKWPYEHLIPYLEKEFHLIYAKAGDLILYLEKTLHGSFANISSYPRPAFTGGIIHKKANILYAKYIEERGEVESYEVDSAFYYGKEFQNPIVDKKYPLIKTEKYKVKEITSLDLDKFFHAH